MAMMQRRKEPEPLAEIHPAAAGKYDIGNRDWIIVGTLRDSIELKAKVTENIVPGVYEQVCVGS